MAKVKPIGKYDNYKLGKIKQVTPQANMLIATIRATKKVLFDETDEKEYIIFICTNNNTQFETIISKSAWELIK